MRKNQVLEKVLKQVENTREEIVNFVKKLIKFRNTNDILTPDKKPLQGKGMSGVCCQKT